MSGVSIKTVNMVKDFMKIHPSVCMLNGKIGISSAIQLTLGSVLSINCWLNEESGIFENLKKA